VEVGMGGRLDSTNVLKPLVSLITNIGMDHQQFLGDTLQKIAFEKGGIIKEGIPVVISETQPETERIFRELANARNTACHFADQEVQCREENSKWTFLGHKTYSIEAGKFPDYQKNNLRGVIAAVDQLKATYELPADAVMTGIENVQALTGLFGRWQQIGQSPDVYCDVGHNEDGVKLLMRQVGRQKFNHLFIIWGTVKDKDLQPILTLLPESASYVFCEADIPRSLPAEALQLQAKKHGLSGKAIKNVNDALQYCLSKAAEDDLIVIGGSNFVVAELKNLK
jgi:dihydrofolate synthase/folylpolyglutamate synthase